MTSTARPFARPRARHLAVIAAVPVTTAAFLLGTAGPASAHERWFADSAPGGDWAFFFRPLPLALALAVVAVTVVWRLVAARLPRPELRVLQPIGRLTPYVPRLLAIHLGVSLLAFSVTGAFLTPALELHDVPGGTAAGLAEAAVGIWLITGVRLRAAAAGVALLGPAALLAAGPVAVLETAPLLGIALFLAVLPPSDGTFGRVEPSPERLRTAIFLLKSFVALGLVTLAFSEKFTNPELARNTLHAYPQLTILSGLGVAPDTFIVIAGTVELLFGLLVLSGALPQVAVLVAMVPFNATLLIFGTTETIGHLPVYGVFLTLLAYGSDPRTAAAVPWLPGRDDLARGLTWVREATRTAGTRRPAATPAVTP